MGGAWCRNSFPISRCGFERKKKAHLFCVNLIHIFLILFCLLFTTKNVYNYLLEKHL